MTSLIDDDHPHDANYAVDVDDDDDAIDVDVDDIKDINGTATQSDLGPCNVQCN